MKNLAVFCDESGTFSEYQRRDPYYIVTLIFCDDDADNSANENRLNLSLANLGYPNKTMHTGPMIRREDEFRFIDMAARKKLFRCIFQFMRNADFKYKTFIVEKRQAGGDPVKLTSMLSKQIAAFLKENLPAFTSYDSVTLYYDNGQIELTRILVSVFNSVIQNFGNVKAFPSDFKLAQVADLICTLELLAQKIETKSLTKSELSFFESARVLRKNYFPALYGKRF